jgi:AraC-like DNA-binding protein
LALMADHQKELQNKVHPSFELYSENDKAFFDKVAQIIEQHFAEPDFNHEILCEQLNISRTVLYAKIKSITGLGVHEFIRLIRLKKSAELLIEGKLNVSQIAYEVGFNSVSYYIRCFTKSYGISPKEYARLKR